MSNLLKSKTITIVLIQKLIAGLAKHFNGQTLTIAGSQLKTADIQTQLQSYLTALQAEDTARAAWKASVQSVDALKPATHALIVNLLGFLRTAFGATSATLLDFGLTPRPPSKRTVANKAVAIEKAQATRDVRHTAGPKQKAKLHGTVPPASPVKS